MRLLAFDARVSDPGSFRTAPPGRARLAHPAVPALPSALMDEESGTQMRTGIFRTFSNPGRTNGLL